VSNVSDFRNQTTDQLVKSGGGMPPFHPHCRGRPVAFFGDPKKGLKIKEKDPEKIKNPNSRIRYKKRLEEIKKLKPYELKERINAYARNAEWTVTEIIEENGIKKRVKISERNYQKHFRGRNIGIDSTEELEKKGKEILTEYTNGNENIKVSTYIYSSTGDRSLKFFDHRKKKFSVIISEDSGEIIKLFRGHEKKSYYVNFE